MGFIEQIGVGKERAETGFSAEVDHPAAIFDPWKILWICVAEYPPAERDESLRAGFLFSRCCINRGI